MPTTSFGPKLSQAEYERRVVELHVGQPAMPDAAEDERLQRAELELAIDHRLGRDFPEDRRCALWEVHRRVQAHRLRSAFTTLMLTLLRRRASDRLATRLFDAYRSVLTSEEFEQFFELGGASWSESPRS